MLKRILNGVYSCISIPINEVLRSEFCLTNDYSDSVCEVNFSIEFIIHRILIVSLAEIFWDTAWKVILYSRCSRMIYLTDNLHHEIQRIFLPIFRWFWNENWGWIGLITTTSIDFDEYTDFLSRRGTSDIVDLTDWSWNGIEMDGFVVLLLYRPEFRTDLKRMTIFNRRCWYFYMPSFGLILCTCRCKHFLGLDIFGRESLSRGFHLRCCNGRWMNIHWWRISFIKSNCFIRWLILNRCGWRRCSEPILRHTFKTSLLFWCWQHLRISFINLSQWLETSLFFHRTNEQMIWLTLIKFANAYQSVICFVPVSHDCRISLTNVRINRSESISVWMIIINENQSNDLLLHNKEYFQCPSVMNKTIDTTKDSRLSMKNQIFIPYWMEYDWQFDEEHS